MRITRSRPRCLFAHDVHMPPRARPRRPQPARAIARSQGHVGVRPPAREPLCTCRARALFFLGVERRRARRRACVPTLRVVCPTDSQCRNGTRRPCAHPQPHRDALHRARCIALLRKHRALVCSPSHAVAPRQRCAQHGASPCAHGLRAYGVRGVIVQPASRAWARPRATPHVYMVLWCNGQHSGL